METKLDGEKKRSIKLLLVLKKKVYMRRLFSTDLILWAMWVSCELLSAGAYACGTPSPAGPIEEE